MYLKLSVLAVLAVLFIAGCITPGIAGNQTNATNGTVKPLVKQNITCADNTFKVANGSVNAFNSSAINCRNDCSRISPNATCDPLTCLCKTENRSCIKNSFDAAVGNNTFNAATMLCKDDCASLDPDSICSPKTCTCVQNVTKKEDVFCINNTIETSLTGTNPFDNDTMLCKDDCARLGADFACDKNCTCKQVVPPKIDMNCGANTIIAPLFGNFFNPATMLCRDDCAATFGAGWKCDGVSCTCSKPPPPDKFSCAGNSFGVAFGLPNEFDPAKNKCEDDCKDFGPGWVCDGKTCLCEKKPKDETVSCAFNAFDVVVLGADNNFNPAKMKCEDDCEEVGLDWYCDAASCTCKEKPGENETQSCKSNTWVVNVPKGQVAAGVQCKDDCKELGSTYVCDPEGCFCKETRTVTPRCGDGYVSGPDTPGGGFEECDVGYGFYQPKDAAGNPYNTPDTCPPPTVCDAPTCKCVEPVTESFCGDGEITGAEQCDYASASTNKCSSGSYCTNSCACKILETSPRCGDGKISIESGEQCDGGSVNTNICQPGYKCYTPECQCILVEGSGQCGDGTVTPPEECDHGNSFTAQCSSGLTCHNCECTSYSELTHLECDYQLQRCVEVSGAGDDGCSSDSQCKSVTEAFCGNNDREGSEECDGSDDSACASDEYCSQNCQCVQSVTTPQYHTECDFAHGACVQVEGAGQNECSSDSQCVPPVVDCPAYCAGQGYSQVVQGSYSSASQCQAAAAESAQTCTTKCVYSKFYSTSNQAGTTTCCCKQVEVFQCSDCPGENPQCPDPNVVCPANQP
ncbi:MAG: hypothetical protein AB1529_07625 [Candidatus Micrarchaeota archaeon]